YRDLQPLLDCRASWPGERDATGVDHAGPGTHGDCGCSRERRPCTRRYALSHLKLKVAGAERAAWRQTDDVDHQPIQATVVAGVICTRCGTTWEQSSLVS